jgi:hypothetical protein
VQECIVGFDDLAFDSKNEDADDVGVDQASDLRFAFLEIAVKTCILQGDRGL